MPIMRVCGHPRCGALIGASELKCATHKKAAAQAEQQRTVKRFHREQWRRLYRTPEWRKCKKRVRARDGFMCRNCGKHGDPKILGYGLEVHHRAPLATLWHRCNGEWDLFLPLATQDDICLTLCPPCHREEDIRLANEQRQYRDQTNYAPPRRTPKDRRRGR